MNNLKLSLLKKWELDSELSFVHGSVLLPDGTAVILTTGLKSDWDKYYLLVLSSDGIKKVPIEYEETSSRDYPVVFRYGASFGLIISAKELRYYSGIHSLPEIIPIKNKSQLRGSIVPEKAQQRYFQNISDSKTIPVCFENEFYCGDARCFALLEFNVASKSAEWKCFSVIDKMAFIHQDDSRGDAPKIDSIKISDKEIYVFIPGDSQTSVNKWGMNY